ncbi:hypothetical protein BGZ94_008002 [Podila epigama]|nr:hypothetical protein BGZ94_008002 [Podila epigama]
MNSNTETWASKVAGGKPQAIGNRYSHGGSHPEMSSSEHIQARQQYRSSHQQATPMRHAHAHSTESEYQVAGHDFGGSRPRVIEREHPVSANEDPINELHQPLPHHVRVKVRGPTTVFSSMGGTRDTASTIIDFDGDSNAQHHKRHVINHHGGTHDPYHARHPIMLESGDMYTGLGRALFGAPRNDTSNRSEQHHRSHNMGSASANIGDFFKEPSIDIHSKGSHHHHHHVEPFNAPAHHVHANAQYHDHYGAHHYVDEEDYYTNHQPIHAHPHHAHHESHVAVYKHPMHHGIIPRRHYGVDDILPDLHLDSFFQEPAWYSGKSKKAVKRAIKKATKNLHHIDPFNAPVHLIHPVGSHGHPSGHVDEEGYYMNHQPIHSHQASHHGHTSDPHRSYHGIVPGRTGGQGSGHHEASNAPVHFGTGKSGSHSTSHHEHHDHNEAGYYLNHQPIHGNSHHSGSHPSHHHHSASDYGHLESQRLLANVDEQSHHHGATHGYRVLGAPHNSVYKYTYEPHHHHHPNAPANLGEMHLERVFKEPAGYATSRPTPPHVLKHAGAHQTQHGGSSHPSHHHIDPFNAPVHLIHPVASHGHPSGHIDEDGYYMNHQPTHAHQSTHNRRPSYASVVAGRTGGQGTSHHEPFNAPVHLIHPVSKSHSNSHPDHHYDDHNEEGYYMNHQPIHGNSHHSGSHPSHHHHSASDYGHLDHEHDHHHHHYAPANLGEMHLERVFKEPAGFATSRPTPPHVLKHAGAHQAQHGGSSHPSHPSHHHVDPFNAPVHLIHPVGSHGHPSGHVDEEGFYMNHQPIHGYSQHHPQASYPVYKHPIQHRAVHRHHNAPVGTPEMHLDALFKEPSSTTIHAAPHDFIHVGHHSGHHSNTVDGRSYASVVAGKTGGHGVGSHSAHHIHSYHPSSHHYRYEPFNAPVHLIHPVGKSTSHSSVHHGNHNEEGYTMYYQPVQGNRHHYITNRSIHSHSSHPALHGHSHQHQHQQHHHHHHHRYPAADIGDMHLELLFREPAGFATSRPTPPHYLKTASGAKQHSQRLQVHHHEPFNAPAHLIHPVKNSSSSSHHSSAHSHPSSSSHPTSSSSHATSHHHHASHNTWGHLQPLLADTKSVDHVHPYYGPPHTSSSGVNHSTSSGVNHSTSSGVNYHPHAHAQHVSSSTGTGHSTHSIHSGPLTYDQVSRIAVPIGKTVSSTTVTRTSVTLMSVPFSYSPIEGHKQHLHSQHGHMWIDFTGPVSHIGQSAIWVRKIVTKETIQGHQVLCQSCNRAL